MSETYTALPVLALRGMVVFPEQTVHFDVGRLKSALALEEAMKHEQLLFLASQKDLSEDDPDLPDLYSVGTVGKIKQILKSQGENIRVLVTGLYRARAAELIRREPFLSAQVERLEDLPVPETLRSHALRREANSLYGNYLELVERQAQTIQLRMLASKDSGFVADCIAQNSGIEYPDKVKLLCQLNPVKRLETAVVLLRQEVQMLRLEGDIQEKTRAQIDRDQKDYYLREQLKIIREELGEDDEPAEFAVYAETIRRLEMDEESKEKLLKDLERLEKQPFGSSEAAVLRGYLDTVLELPWNHRTKERIDVEAARKVLDRDHYGLEKVKERILETLAVRKMAPPSPIPLPRA